MTLALSIRQPWAWAILSLGKDIENRTWSTRVRGRILLHAAKTMTAEEWEDGLFTARAVARVRPFSEGTTFAGRKALLFGGIVGEAEIVDCVRASDSPWFFGPFGFVLRNARPLPFRPLKGALGFFEAAE